MAEPDTRSRTREVRLGDRRYPVVGPSVRDPRLHVAAVVVSLQVLGQTVLHFDVSIAQILIAVATCAAIETAITMWRQRVIAWPASGAADRERRRVRLAGSGHAARRLVERHGRMDLRGGRRGVVAVEVPDPGRPSPAVQPVELRPGVGLLGAREPPRRSTRLLVGTARHRALARAARSSWPAGSSSRGG